jgi:tetratricopeptide (TPR) repeat protein
MRIPASTLAFLLLALPCAAQQSQQSSDQSQNSSQPPSQAQDQNKSADKSQSGRQAPAKPHSTADDNPFPEDISKKAASDAGNPAPDAPAAKSAKPPTSADGSKSAPAPDYSSSRTGLKNLDSNDPEARISDGAGGYIFDPKLAAQDVKVGGFYLTNSDYKGAYARYKEATKVDPTNVNAVFGLAEAARGLKLTSEAVENYRVYLDADPDGPKAKAARKALAQLGEAAKK